jgi:hypothetical protein
MMQVPHVQAQTFKQNLECPISLNRINTAMTLDPCGHSVNTDIAQGLFGAIIGGMAVNPGPCPVCATHVVKYIPNIALRNTAQDVDALLPDILPPVLPAIPMAPLVATLSKAMFTAVVTGLSTAVGINFYEYLKK